jgi:homospermidine synthase
MIELAQELGALYIDTVAEPWKGFYTDNGLERVTTLELRVAGEHP